MEWLRANEKIDAATRDQAMGELIGLVGAVDGIVKMQAEADAEYFVQVAARVQDAVQVQAIHKTQLEAYRWQYIVNARGRARLARARLRSRTQCPNQRGR